MRTRKDAEQRTSWLVHLANIAQFSERSTVSSLGKEAGPESNQRLIRKLHILEDTNIANTLKPLESMPITKRAILAPKCSAGCSHCCHQWVRVTVPEVLAVVSYIRQNCSETQIARYIAAAKTYRAEFVKVPPKARMAIPCPMLIDDKCSVYAARPFICRGMTSLNVDKCIEARTNLSEPVPVPVIQPLVDISAAVSTGLLNGLKKSGIASESVVLGLALLVALEDPQAGEKYFSGEDVFSDCRAPEA